MELVCVAEFSNPVEANIAKGMLENHDIPSVLDNETIVSVLPMTSAIGGVRLMVRKQDYDASFKLLEEHDDLEK
ncbi:MAG: DUF2007 domain-containing protein [Duncaniella sp.]|nr:DUF2007 domain-containing protein [Muribaculum sp.]MCM1255685.1 DUF2007 domain-containing protein [Duncaniella sp.]